MTRGEGGRWMEPWTLGQALRLFGWSGLLISCVVLTPPMREHLFAMDGEGLAPPVKSALETVRLIVGSAGLVLLAAGLHARPLTGKPLPLRRGHAALVLVCLALGFLAVEATLRLRDWRRWGSAARTPLPLSAIRRSGEVYHRPGRYAREGGSDYRPGRREAVFITVNRFGLRGPLPAVPKPPHLTRIVCLGGSSTFGFVSDGEDWPTRLGVLLGSRGGIEVLNAGRPGSTTWSDFTFLRDRLMLLEPDAVVLYEGFNDLWRGVRRHSGEQRDYGLVDETLPPGEEALDLGEPRPWPARASFVAFYAGRLLDSRLDSPAIVPPRVPSGRFRFDPAVVSLFERNLASMVRFCRARGVLPVIVTFAACDDPSRPEPERRLRLKYVLDQVPPLDLRTAQAGIDLYRGVTRKVARDEGAPLVDAAELMTKDTAFYTDTIHLTPEGEDRLARVIAAQLGPVLRPATPRLAAPGRAGGD